MVRMAKPTILITGCSSGIGNDAAHGLRRAGWRVFAACRKPADCDRLRSEGFDSPRIDYADPQSIADGLAEVLDATGGTLDALFNNGAYAVPGFAAVALAWAGVKYASTAAYDPGDAEMQKIARRIQEQESKEETMQLKLAEFKL